MLFLFLFLMFFFLNVFFLLFGGALVTGRFVAFCLGLAWIFVLFWVF